MGRIGIALGLVVGFASTPAQAIDPLPEGDAGIAVGYPGDAGIDGHADVVFADDFESYGDASELGNAWDVIYQADLVGLTTDPAAVFAGNQALEMIVPQQDTELSNAADKLVSPELDVLFLRYYAKFQPPYDVVGSSHNGSMISSHYFDNGQATPGIPADGTNKFLVNLENWRGEAATPSPGDLNVYVYHPAQRSDYGDHFFPTGTVLPNSSLPFDFGPDFEPRPDFVPDLDTWYCYELMVQANTPGQSDGRIAFWVDGALAADFPNLRLREVPELQIDRFGLQFHIGSNPNGETRKWYDNVVAATSYIGPLYVEGGGGTGGDGGPGDGSGGADGTGEADGSASASASASDGGGATSGGDASGSGGTAGGAMEGTGAAAGDDGGGCGCRATPTTPPWWLGLGLLAMRRRRRRALRAV